LTDYFDLVIMRQMIRPSSRLDDRRKGRCTPAGGIVGPEINILRPRRVNLAVRRLDACANLT
jgi:hypothetical protein